MDETTRKLFMSPGYVPTEDDVAAVIEAEGQWGKAPTYIPCPVCNYPIFDGVCAACNADGRI